MDEQRGQTQDERPEATGELAEADLTQASGGRLQPAIQKIYDWPGGYAIDVTFDRDMDPPK